MGFGDTLNQLPEGLKQGDGAPQKNDFDLIASPETSSKKRRVELKKHECPEIGCSAKFSRPYRLKNHILTHHGDAGKPYKCTFEDCSKTYSSQSHLKRHEIAAHLGEDVESTEVLCEEENCGLIFSNKYNLKKHIARIHADLPFECHTCSEKFRRKSQLNVHKVEIHTEEAPYNCKDCPKTFVQFHQYQKHQRSHKNYKCDCDEIFSRWTEYLKHKKTSCSLPKTQYTCAICNKTFSLKQNLAEHCLHVHLPDSRSEVFKCSYIDCNRSYHYKKNLDFHIKKFHSQIVDYHKCTVEKCGKVLKSKKNLKQHLRLCHSDKPLTEKVRRKPRNN
ncbi:zinc finger protein 266 [Dendroctonus ponderosae]|uniref:C2H2-type domain-containing protein n=1 Tax=Dendroctonus ponderosae TaxID=77166 RepID=U4U261_DENPD|nr:zinc finger protein 266 [Dendroctonus ponderosae]XP_048519362.1 zinc finger protein 266-like [Dendroctonus ponderosae]XP_048519363.1 zinc finger protein 266-like [Dendroctonus ponderosae]XP_048519364.1 zinc finger protein 266-like [Dendroctonus ponderosae]XP_048519365.1 zinc finger protein 266-like [Dendroctonus ponderosae]XP_048519366.1 zinc finger protein 266-like [Dendroctonus ponderosae]XP_048519367.1 zinc finger protein 266-like [Dendroctonus ponderosae]XP_048522187.1 zinc finger pro